MTQFGVLLWEGVPDQALVLRWFCEPSSLSPTGRLKPELVCIDTSPTAGMGLAGAVVCCAWDGRREEDCFFGDGVAGGCADVPCSAADGSVTERGFHGSCCAWNLSNQSLNVATGMAAAAVFSTSRIRCRAGWNSSRRYASNRELGVAALAVDCAFLDRAAAWVMRMSAELCQASIPSSLRLIFQ